MADGTPTPDISISTAKLSLIKGAISCLVAATIKIVIFAKFGIKLHIYG